LFSDPPAPWCLACDRATDRKPDVRVRIRQQVLPTDELEQVLRDRREVGGDCGNSSSCTPARVSRCAVACI
jgi:hypothetical protein